MVSEGSLESLRLEERDLVISNLKEQTAVYKSIVGSMKNTVNAYELRHESLSERHKLAEKVIERQEKEIERLKGTCKKKLLTYCVGSPLLVYLYVKGLRASTPPLEPESV